MTQYKTLLTTIAIIVLIALGWYLGETSQQVSPNPGQSTLQSESSMPRFTVGGWELSIATEPSTPMVGENTLVLELRDADGNPATGTTIRAYAEMPSMGAMPSMRAPTGQLLETTPGHYEGTMDLSMRGEWPLTVQIENHPVLGDRRLKFDLATDRPGLSIASGGTRVGGRATASDDDEQVFSIDNRRRQLIGLKTGVATHRHLVKDIRAVGQVTYDERRLSQVTLKYDGYIGDLKANYVGAKVLQGQVLLTVYSPELLAAQREYLETRKRRGNKSSSDPLMAAARQRLALWDMTETEIESLERRGKALDYVPIHASHAGTVIERHIADGSGARAGHPVLTIADLSRVWVEADVYEGDLALLTTGSNATIALPYLPGQTRTAQIEYIYPYLQAKTRTGKVRMTLDNAAGDLKPDMYAEVTLEVDLGHRLSVPEEAVLVAGGSRVVFVDLGEGRLKPVYVTTGHTTRGMIEIRQGLELGDRIVTSGNFLVAAEARLRLGIQQW
jgi:Cu(I)/Ag(I) efflux system membrane fusion protein